MEGRCLRTSRCTGTSLMTCARKIKDARLRPNEKLPTEGDLSEQYKASRNTVREAIRRLTDEGLLESRPGQGTFVARKVDPFVTVLTADPKTGFGGGETVAYRSEVQKKHREPTTSVPKVEVVTVSVTLLPCWASRGAAGCQPFPGPFHRWNPLVQADHVLPDGLHHQGRNRPADGERHRRWRRGVPGREAGVKQTGYRDWILGGWRPTRSRPSSGSATTPPSSSTLVSPLTRTKPPCG